MKSFVVGGGCFWCIDAVFRQFQGVKASVCGYAGGYTQNPDYRSVCSGTTGHHEVVRVDFDESIISEDAILDIFFAAHDATSWISRVLTVVRSTVPYCCIPLTNRRLHLRLRKSGLSHSSTPQLSPRLNR